MSVRAWEGEFRVPSRRSPRQCSTPRCVHVPLCDELVVTRGRRRWYARCHEHLNRQVRPSVRGGWEIQWELGDRVWTAPLSTLALGV